MCHLWESSLERYFLWAEGSGVSNVYVTGDVKASLKTDVDYLYIVFVLMFFTI